MTEEWLRQNALWVIVDPWHHQPTDKYKKRTPNIDCHNEVTIKKILHVLPNIKHTYISVPYDTGEPMFEALTPHPLMAHLPNLHNSFANLHLVMKRLKLNDIVYCGFHYGICIIDRPVGAKIMSKYYNIWYKKDLCSLLPCGITWEKANEISSIYGTIF